METLAQSKFFIALGGFLGFCMCFASGLLASTEITLVLRDASVGAVVGAFLMKVFLLVLHSNVQAVMQNRHMERKRALEEEAMGEDEELDDIAEEGV